MSSIQHLAAVRRLDGARSAIRNPQGVPCTLLAREDVAVEGEAIEQLLELLALQDTLDDLWRRERAGSSAPFFGDTPGRIAQVVLTPDFHRGAGIPVGTVLDARGFVIPAAVGSDVCCGMRLLATDLRAEELAPARPQLERRLRAVFFEGERDIPLSPRQREAILREGLPGHHATRGDNGALGIWRRYDPRAQEADLSRVHAGGGFPTDGVALFADYIRASGARDGRDPQIGSVTSRSPTGCSSGSWRSGPCRTRWGARSTASWWATPRTTSSGRSTRSASSTGRAPARRPDRARRRRAPSATPGTR